MHVYEKIICLVEATCQYKQTQSRSQGKYANFTQESLLVHTLHSSLQIFLIK